MIKKRRETNSMKNSIKFKRSLGLYFLLLPSIIALILFNFTAFYLDGSYVWYDFTVYITGTRYHCKAS